MSLEKLLIFMVLSFQLITAIGVGLYCCLYLYKGGVGYLVVWGGLSCLYLYKANLNFLMTENNHSLEGT